MMGRALLVAYFAEPSLCAASMLAALPSVLDVAVMSAAGANDVGAFAVAEPSGAAGSDAVIAELA